MKSKLFGAFVLASLLLLQSCNKKDVALLPEPQNTAKVETIEPGGMTGILPTGTYKFVSYVSTIDPAINKSIGVTGGSTATGALIEQRDFAGTVQEWRVTHTGYGTYSIINYKSGLAIDDQYASQAENNPIWQYPFNGNPAQEWIIEYQGYGVYRIKSLVNPNMGLHISGGSTANGAKLVLKTFTGGTVGGWGYFFIYPMPISNPPVTIHTPDALHTDTYPRVVQLPSGNLLASFAYWTTGYIISTPKYYKSTNQGASWTYISSLTDTRSNSDGYFDPELFVMPVTIGSTTAGTILTGVRSQISFGKSYIDLYKSTNEGATWTLMSTIAIGNSQGHNVYEPFFLIDGYGRFICYYSDERDAAHSQKLVYQISPDGGLTWNPTVYDVVALPNQSDRPGMLRAAKMGNGKWIMTYEYVGYPNVAAVTFKTSADGVNWTSGSTNPGTVLTSIDGVIPGTSPSIIWTPSGSTSGTVIVTAAYPTSGGCYNFINFTSGTGNWYRVPQPLPYTYTTNNNSGYSRSVGLSTDGKTLYHINCVSTNATNASTKFVATPAW